ncbi:Zinc finger CHCC-type, partial [Trinorchestia longiramus]
MANQAMAAWALGVRRGSPRLAKPLAIVHRCFTSQKAGEDLVTHTGQSWSADDYRNVRFINNPKQVNSKWSIDLIKAVPPVVVEGRVAVCEGGPSEALGHPKIYINL